MEVLEHLDKYGISDCKLGDPPCLLVDGHGS